MRIPERVAPENYPIAWLMDTWRGGGVLEYENVPASAYLHELRLDNNDGGPYLRFTSTIWLANEPASVVENELTGEYLWDHLTKGQLWSSAVGFLRVNPEASTGQDGTTPLEALVASPSGTSQVWVGVVKGPQLQLVTDVVARSAAGADLTNAKIMAGNVQSELFYAYDMEAFGFPMRSYFSGRLSRTMDSSVDMKEE